MIICHTEILFARKTSIKTRAGLNYKPIAPCTRDFSRALSKFQIIARNCDWFIALFVPVVIGRAIILSQSLSVAIAIT